MFTSGPQDAQASFALAQVNLPKTYTTSLLNVVLQTVHGTGNSRTTTLWFDTIFATTLTCTVSDTSTTCSDGTHSQNLIAGDVVAFEVQTSGVGTAASIVDLSWICT